MIIFRHRLVWMDTNAGEVIILRNKKQLIWMWGYTAIALAAGVAILIVVIYVCGKSILRIRSEGVAYAAAMRRSGETAKRLVVVGDPASGWFGAGFGGGDVCVKSADAAAWLTEQPNDSAVIFLGERVKDLAELQRVAGADVFSENDRLRESSSKLVLDVAEEVLGGDSP